MPLVFKRSSTDLQEKIASRTSWAAVELAANKHEHFMIWKWLDVLQDVVFQSQTNAKSFAICSLCNFETMVRSVFWASGSPDRSSSSVELKNSWLTTLNKALGLLSLNAIWNAVAQSFLWTALLNSCSNSTRSSSCRDCTQKWKDGNCRGQRLHEKMMNKENPHLLGNNVYSDIVPYSYSGVRRSSHDATAVTCHSEAPYFVCMSIVSVDDFVVAQSPDGPNAISATWYQLNRELKKYNWVRICCSRNACRRRDIWRSISQM